MFTDLTSPPELRELPLFPVTSRSFAWTWMLSASLHEAPAVGSDLSAQLQSDTAVAGIVLDELV